GFAVAGELEGASGGGWVGGWIGACARAGARACARARAGARACGRGRELRGVGGFARGVLARTGEGEEREADHRSAHGGIFHGAAQGGQAWHAPSRSSNDQATSDGIRLVSSPAGGVPKA